MKLKAEIKWIDPKSTNTNPSKYSLEIKGIGPKEECDMILKRIIVPVTPKIKETRPNIVNFFPKNTKLKAIQKEYSKSSVLWEYINALDIYIDELEEIIEKFKGI